MAPNYPHTVNGETTTIVRCPDKTSVSVGYANGDIKIINYIQKSITTTLRGHKSAVTCIVFSDQHDGAGQSTDSRRSVQTSSLMASGGLDNDINIWDYVAHSGVCKLRGHKDTITGLSFVYFPGNGVSGGRQMLVSVSKDSLMKVWDLATFSCVQTIVGHRCEIYSVLAVHYPAVGDQAGEVRVFTGAADEYLRCYRMATEGSPADESDADAAEGEAEGADGGALLKFFGSIPRGGGMASGAVLDKCVGLLVSPGGNVLIAQSAGKLVEFFYIRSPEEVTRKFKRRCKRLREKAQDGAQEEGAQQHSKNVWENGVDAGVTPTGESEPGLGGGGAPTLRVDDELDYLGCVRTLHKVRGVDCSPHELVAATTTVEQADADGATPGKKRGKTVSVTTITTTERVLLSLNNNTVIFYDVAFKQHQSAAAGGGAKGKVLVPAELQPVKTGTIEFPGHRSDVRGVCVSSDNNTVVTCSPEELKCWSRKTFCCIKSCKMEFYALCVVLVPGDKYCLVGTKEGHIALVDTLSGDIVDVQEGAHTAAVWTMALRPDGKTFMTGSADKDVKFWELFSAGGKVGFKLTRQLQMTHDVLCVRYSTTTKMDKLLLAVGLLDNTIKIFHDDSVKFFLSLYGHKAPVMCIDMSYDNTILVSGSADKTIKIWGLDFGDCHRSLIAHEDSVTCLRFQPKTHYFFSCGKDGVVKYWDADRFEQILRLPGHTAGVWGLDVSPDASYVASVSADRSVRLWERNTGDMVFVEEEKELAMEAMVSSSIERQQKDAGSQLVLSGDGGTVAVVGGDAGAVLATHIDVVKGGERLMESIDLVEKELGELQESRESRGATYAANPVMMGMTPFPYLVHILRTAIKGSELESALLILPFHYVVRFIPMLTEICRLQLDIELSTKCVIFLLRNHMPRLINTQAVYTDMLALKAVLKSSICGYRDVVGTNVAALSFLSNKVSEQNEFAVSMGDINRGKGPSKDDKKQKKQRLA